MKSTKSTKRDGSTSEMNPMMNNAPGTDESARVSRGNIEREGAGPAEEPTFAPPAAVSGRGSIPPGERPTPELFDETEDRE